MRLRHPLVCGVLAGAIAIGAVMAFDRSGPVHWNVERVVDGDTLVASDGEERFRVRLVGLDAPELRGACALERALAVEAKAALVDLLWAGTVTFEPQGTDQYGRVLAIVMVGGQDVSPLMIAAGLARPYHGEHRKGWC